MASPTKEIVVVFGATGVTGGSVARYLLEDGTFAVRAITRNASGTKAQALKASGADIVEADMGRPETLAAAMQGAYGVIALTDFWSIFPAIGFDAVKAEAEEERHGRNLIDAAKAAGGVQHFVWFDIWTGGVPHWDGKARVGEYLAASGLPHTRIVNCFYFENLVNPVYGMITKDETGVVIVNFSYPSDLYIPSYSTNQSGGWVLAVLKNREQYLGRQIIAIGEHLTPRMYVEIIGKALPGVTVKIKEVNKDAFEARATSQNPYEKPLYLNLKAFADRCQPPNSLYGDEAASKTIYPEVWNFEQFVRNDEGFKRFLATFTA